MSARVARKGKGGQADFLAALGHEVSRKMDEPYGAPGGNAPANTPANARAFSAPTPLSPPPTPAGWVPPMRGYAPTSGWAVASGVASLMGLLLLMLVIAVIGSWSLIISGVYVAPAAGQRFVFDARVLIPAATVLIGFPLTGVLCGHIAQWRLKRAQGGLAGRNWLIAGLTLGYFSLALEIVAPLLFILLLTIAYSQGGF